MRLPGLAAEYIRTCADCGRTWRVPRAFARRGFQSLSTSILETTSGPGPPADSIHS
jgi:hypothetical protein